MTHRLARQGLVVGSCLLAFLASACTPGDPPAPPPTSSAPVASPTPTENAQEREQRLAYEAAETSYREFRAEVERVYSKGGAAKPTTAMKATAGGPYLKSYQEVSEAYLDLKHHSRGPLEIAYVHHDGYSPSELILDACEDIRNVVTFDAKGKKLYAGDVRKVHLTVRSVAGTWKVWSGKGEQVSACT
jgi:hypothetical protein